MSSSGDRASVRFLVAGRGDVVASLMGKEAGGTKLEIGFAERLLERFGDRVATEVVFEPCPDLSTLLSDLKSASPALPVVQRMRKEHFDVLVTSLWADLSSPLHETASGSVRAAAFLQHLLDLIRTIKEEFGCHMIFMNASTIDPVNHVSNYSRVSVEPAFLTANRLNLALIRASVEEGISIVDVDRLIAELGAADNVEGFLDYSVAGSDAICNELIRVVDDYGFFDDRPLLMQIGNSSRS